jgi:hypothetical protein
LCASSIGVGTATTTNSAILECRRGRRHAKLSSGLQVRGRQLARGIDVAPVGLHLRSRKIKTDRRELLPELDGERQPDVTEADDCNGGHDLAFPSSFRREDFHSKLLQQLLRFGLEWAVADRVRNDLELLPGGRLVAPLDQRLGISI